jgi:hypothetical protein
VDNTGYLKINIFATALTAETWVYLGEYVKSALNILKFGAVQGWRKTVGPIVQEIECSIELKVEVYRTCSKNGVS